MISRNCLPLKLYFHLYSKNVVIVQSRGKEQNEEWAPLLRNVECPFVSLTNVAEILLIDYRQLSQLK